MQPQLIIVAGAPGSGKSRAFPVSEFGVDFFNADDRAAERNGGYHGISLQLRSLVNREFESFINDHIRLGVSFAFETTLRSTITFEQIVVARRNNFEVTMIYLGIGDVRVNLERIALRWELGYHAAPTDVLLAIHLKSHENLQVACREAFAGRFRLLLYDNTPFDMAPIQVGEVDDGSVRALVEPLPRWAWLAVDVALPGVRWWSGK